MSARAPHGWRTRLKRVPGVAGLARRLFSPSFEGAWLYRQEVVAWLYDPALRRQLPWPLRPFAAWGRAPAPALGRRGVGASPCSGRGWPWARGWGMPDHARLDVGPYAGVRVAPATPRLLQVPNELTPASEHARARGPARSGRLVRRRGRQPRGVLDCRLAPRRAGRGRSWPSSRSPTWPASSAARSGANAPDAATAVHALALGDAPGVLRLHVPRGSSGSATLLDGVASDATWDTLDVPVARLDDVLGGQDLPGRVVVKLDVEGGEAAVLRGARGVRRGPPPPPS